MSGKDGIKMQIKKIQKRIETSGQVRGSVSCLINPNSNGRKPGFTLLHQWKAN